MKIGILTLPLETNYGGILQAFALQRVLHSMGHEVLTIDRHNRKAYKSFGANVLGFCNRLKQKYLEGKDVSIRWNPFMSREVYRKITYQTRDFVTRNMVLTREVWSDQLAEIDKEYQFDAYVVGSDQVWLPGYFPGSFLNFVTRKNVIKLFYAASGNFGFINRKENVEACKRFASEFNAISVREDALVGISEKYLGKKTELVLDPTLLLDSEDYLSVTKNNVGEEPILFVYVLDSSKEKDSLINAVNEKTKLPVVKVNASTTYVKKTGINIDECIFPPVDDWLRNLYRADYVITDSFHGTVFSILFNKQFIAIGNAKRGMNRFTSLLKLFHLEDRLITEFNKEYIDKLTNKKINFQVVNSILMCKRIESLSFLERNLI